MSQQLNVDLSSATDVVCELCACRVFDAVALIKKVSALVSPTGKEGHVPIQTFACKKCGHINKEFDPTAE
jgi:hypothetical protein